MRNGDEWGADRHPSRRAPGLGDLLLQNPNRARHWHVFDSVPQAFALHSTFLNWLDGIYPLLGRDGWDSRQFDLCQLFNLWQLLSTVVHFNYCSWAQMSQRWAQCHINTINTDNISKSASFLGEECGATDCPFLPTCPRCLPVFGTALEGAAERGGGSPFLPFCWCAARHPCFHTKIPSWLVRSSISTYHFAQTTPAQALWPPWQRCTWSSRLLVQMGGKAETAELSAHLCSPQYY